MSDLPAPFTANGVQAAGSDSASPDGVFEYVINYPHHSGGPAGITTFSFDVAAPGLSLSSIASNGKAYFAVDMLANNGNTGNVAANSFVTGGVPEPSTWAMMLIGFAGLGYAGFRQTRKTPRFV